MRIKSQKKPVIARRTKRSECNEAIHKNNNMDGCFATLTKQGEAEISLFNPVDCHDFASQNLAMTEISQILRFLALDSAIQIKNAESAPKIRKNHIKL
ncbi:hypothetical protein ACWIUD_09380 [Helicobacter sp. 23-1044]